MLECGRRVSPEVWRRIAGTLDRQLDHLDLNPCRLYRLDIEDWFLCRFWVSGEDLLLFQDRDDGSELYRIDQRFFSEAVRAVMLQHIEFVVLLQTRSTAALIADGLRLRLRESPSHLGRLHGRKVDVVDVLLVFFLGRLEISEGKVLQEFLVFFNSGQGNFRLRERAVPFVESELLDLRLGSVLLFEGPGSRRRLSFLVRIGRVGAVLRALCGRQVLHRLVTG
jgi:hypothetical protein